MFPSSRVLWKSPTGDEDGAERVGQDDLLTESPVLPVARPTWRPREISDDLSWRAHSAHYTNARIFGNGHTEVLTWIPEGFDPDFDFERIGDTIKLTELDIELQVRAPADPTFGDMVVTCAIFWDRTYPPNAVGYGIERYLSYPLSALYWPYLPRRPHNSYGDVEMLWAEDVVLHAPRHDLVTNPVQPFMPALHVIRKTIDLRGLITQFYGPSAAYQDMGPGTLVYATLCNNIALYVTPMEQRLAWTLWYQSGKNQDF